jgi:hypothetical protein
MKDLEPALNRYSIKENYGEFKNSASSAVMYFRQVAIICKQFYSAKPAKTKD